MKKRKSFLQKVLIGFGILVGIFVILIFALTQIAKDWEEPETIFNDIVLENIQDGTYSGFYEAKPISVELSVTVTNNKITDIQIIRHRHGKGKDAEKIVNHVIESQSLMVDTISGATLSSKSILKAIENALLN